MKLFHYAIKKIKLNKVLVENFSSLGLLQVFNLLLPLVTYPYLIRILGKEIYGSVVFAQAIAAYYSIIINFGFNISGTRDIAVAKEKNKLYEIVSSIYIIKFILWSFCFFAHVSLLNIIDLFKSDYFLYLFTFFITLNDLLFPIWYFQGIEKMKYITIINLVVRSIFTVSIFFFISSKEDYLFVPLLNAFGALLGGLISIFVVFRINKVEFIKPETKKLLFYLKESFPLFISTLSVQIYVNANKLLIGSFLGMKEVSYYDLGEKFLRILKIPFTILSQTIFPSINREMNLIKLNKIMIFAFIFAVILVGATNIFAEQLVVLLGGHEMLPAVPVLRILSLSVLMVVLSQFWGTLRLIPFGYKKEFSKVIVSSGVFFIIYALILYFIDSLKLISLAWMATLVELWVVVYMFYVCKAKRILI